MNDDAWKQTLQQGTVIPAHPLALDCDRRLDERRQRALSRYYLAAGAGGLAVGVHTTQFAIRKPEIGLYEPVLALAAEEMDRAESATTTGCADGTRPVVRVAGICGKTPQAVGEAETAARLGYCAGLLSYSALREESEEELIEHARRVADVIPVFGFYLQPAVGGRLLSYRFWRRFAEIENVVAIKVACFNRYQTIDVVRALAESGREDIALYTGNDDNIVMDLLTPHTFSRKVEESGGRGSLSAPDRGQVTRRFVGGLLGHWAVWTKRAVGILEECTEAAAQDRPIPAELLRLAIEVTDCNAALFDAANGFAGCIPGVHEVLRRQGLLEGTWCLDPAETLGPGQSAELDRICAAYPHLTDDDFIAEHRDDWLSG